MSIPSEQLSKKDKVAHELEENKQLISALRFLIDDNAFSTDFLITTVTEYLAENKDLTT